MRILFTSLILAVLATSVQAGDGQFRPYVSFGIGASFLDDTEVQGLPSNDVEFDDAFSFGGAFGVHVDPVRLEFEITHREHDIDRITASALAGVSLPIDGDVELTTLMFNVLYDFHPEFLPEPMDFYVGGGLGVSIADVEVKAAGVSGSDDDAFLSYQFLLGTSYELKENIFMTLQYRFLGTTEPEIGGTDIDELFMHGIEFGMRFNF